MIYDEVATLQTVAACDQLLGSVTLDQQDLVAKKIVLERKRTTAVTQSPSIEADIVATQALVTINETYIAGLPDGDLKDSYINELRKAETKLYTLNQRLENYGTLALVSMRYDSYCLDQNITEAGTLIAAINARKAAL